MESSKPHTLEFFVYLSITGTSSQGEIQCCHPVQEFLRQETESNIVILCGVKCLPKSVDTKHISFT